MELLTEMATSVMMGEGPKHMNRTAAVVRGVLWGHMLWMLLPPLPGAGSIQWVNQLLISASCCWEWPLATAVEYKARLQPSTSSSFLLHFIKTHFILPCTSRLNILNPPPPSFTKYLFVLIVGQVLCSARISRCPWHHKASAQGGEWERWIESLCPYWIN